MNLNEFLKPLCNDNLDLYKGDAVSYFRNSVEPLEGAWGKIKNQKMLMMFCQDYLGLLSNKKVKAASMKVCKKVGVGSTGSPPLGGVSPFHVALEEKISQLLETESCIIFSSGYLANLATISTLVGIGDAVMCDNYAHASIIDGCKLSQAKICYFKHNSLENLENYLKNLNVNRKLVVVESVYGMDGDIADIPNIVKLCEKYNAILMVDEAHSFGNLGPKFGIHNYFNLPSDSIPIKMGSFSKNMASVGGFVAGSNKLVSILKAKARGQIFSAAMAPVLVAGVLESISIIENEPERQEKLKKNIQKYTEGLKILGFNILNSKTAIIPIITHSPEKTFEMAKLCRENNVFVFPILYPAVPKRLPRLRTTITSNFSNEDIEYALEVFEKVGKKIKLI